MFLEIFVAFKIFIIYSMISGGTPDEVFRNRDGGTLVLSIDSQTVVKN